MILAWTIFAICWLMRQPALPSTGRAWPRARSFPTARTLTRPVRRWAACPAGRRPGGRGARPGGPPPAAAGSRQLADFVEPVLVATTGPRYFGFVIGGAL